MSRRGIDNEVLDTVLEVQDDFGALYLPALHWLFTITKPSSRLK